MNKLIVPFKAISVILTALFIVAFLQFATYSENQSKEVVWKGACSFQEWGKDSDSDILMKVLCEDGVISEVRSSEAFFTVLHGKTSEFQCEKQKSGKTSCVSKKAGK